MNADTVVMEIDGPHFKDKDKYLSKDGDNPEAPWPGYGWPLNTTCWYFRLEDRGRLRWATGSTVEKAWARAVELAAQRAHDE